MEVGKVGEDGDTYNSVNNKNELKIMEFLLFFDQDGRRGGERWCDSSLKME